ncbi:hypothetical protein HK101_011881 [Irineochytrium annulatum]|nr:hypothetical protein HK101_011881 [Irineochytrium annulatum]
MQYADAIPSEDYIRLTSSIGNMRGAVWAKSPNPHKHWQVHFAVNVYGRAYVGGDGIALWYTKERAVEGPIYGNMDKWTGLGIFLDTSEPTENRFTPFLHGIVNDGYQQMENRKDYMTLSIGGCFRDYRNAPKPVWGRLTYANRTLRLDMDIRQDGYAFTECFTKTGIDLPAGYYFGVSASTAEHNADDHDLIAFETFEVDQKPKAGSKVDDYVIDEETKKKISQVEHIVEEVHKQDAESASPMGYQENFNPNVLQTLLENQFKVIESLNVLYDKVGESPVTPAGFHEDTKNKVREAVQPVDGKVALINNKIDDLARKVELMGGEIQNLFKAIREYDNKGDVNLRDVSRKLDVSNAKLEAAHAAINERPSGNWGFSVTFFLLGGIIVYAVSVLVRMKGRDNSKRLL